MMFRSLHNFINPVLSVKVKTTDHFDMPFMSGDVKRSHIRSNLGTYYGLSEVRLGKEIGVTTCCHVPDEMYYS